MSITSKPFAVIAENKQVGVREEYWVSAQSKVIAAAFVKSFHGPNTKYSVYDLTDINEVCKTSTPIGLLPELTESAVPCFLGIRVSAHSSKSDTKCMPDKRKKVIVSHAQIGIVEEPVKEPEPRKYLRKVSKVKVPTKVVEKAEKGQEKLKEKVLEVPTLIKEVKPRKRRRTKAEMKVARMLEPKIEATEEVLPDVKIQVMEKQQPDLETSKPLMETSTQPTKKAKPPRDETNSVLPVTLVKPTIRRYS